MNIQKQGQSENEGRQRGHMPSGISKWRPQYDVSVCKFQCPNYGTQQEERCQFPLGNIFAHHAAHSLKPNAAPYQSELHIRLTRHHLEPNPTLGPWLIGASGSGLENDLCF